MEYFTLLGTATAIIAGLAWVLYCQRRDLGLLAGIAAMYYWSLYGAWWVVIDKSGGFSGQHYHYLERKMFPVALDGWYLTAIALYAGFIILVELTLLAALSRRWAPAMPRLVLRHEAILILGLAAGMAPAQGAIVSRPMGVRRTRSVRPWPSTSRRSTPSWMSQISRSSLRLALRG